MGSHGAFYPESSTEEKSVLRQFLRKHVVQREPVAVKKSRVLGTASTIGTIKVTAQEFPGLQQEQHTASSAQEAVSRAWDQKCSKKKKS